MKKEEILELIKAVSASNLTAFRYKDGEVSLEFECERGLQPTVITNVNLPVPEETVLEKDENLLVIKSPMVGTYYASKSEKSDPYIQVGDRVKKGQAVGIIEAMKLMNEIECEHDGEIVKILMNNEEMVEFGQPLFLIK